MDREKKYAILDSNLQLIKGITCKNQMHDYVCCDLFALVEVPDKFHNPECYSYIYNIDGVITPILNSNNYAYIQGGQGCLHSYQKLQMIMTERDILLQESNWSVMPDAPISDADKAECITYRNQLFDLLNTLTHEEVANVAPNWPTKPVVLQKF